MKQYLDLMGKLLERGVMKEDRTGTGTLSLFGEQLRFDLQDGFPLLTTKKMFIRGITEELVWFVNGRTDREYLTDRNVRIWNEWESPDPVCPGDMGPVYGFQWRNFGAEYAGPHHDYGDAGVDQLGEVIDNLVRNPFSRRHIVSAWNPVDLPKMALPPCHLLFQFNVRPLTLAQRFKECQASMSRERAPQIEYRDMQFAVDIENPPKFALDCHMYQRSADYFLGVPFNIASYAILVHLIAKITGYAPGELVISFGDVHLYRNHRAQAREQMIRIPVPLPRLRIGNVSSLDEFSWDEVSLVGYQHHPAIKAEISV